MNHKPRTENWSGILCTGFDFDYGSPPLEVDRIRRLSVTMSL